MSAGWLAEWSVGRTGREERPTDGWTDGWTGGWMDGRTDGWIVLILLSGIDGCYAKRLLFTSLSAKKKKH
ncbi:unnamed protein product [Litomosoides sigmodontis]|uniref:Uncharacterized protein n=1 Tax=Litomosoides sigmodontis TaxID=42156 RepID=A0A3P6TG17_LITSI|nr:unnamed protein product [Litomosoides sigmodontis]